jgi:hypothetical protein
MRSRYHFRFPIGIHFYKWGANIWMQQPIVRQYIAAQRKPGDGEISIFLTIFDEED